MGKILFQKCYSCESSIDAPEDMEDAFSDSSLPVDEYGFTKGTFKLTIEWFEDEED